MSRLGWLLALPLVLGGCGGDFTVTGDDPAFGQLRCSAGHDGSGMVILLAQSVPGIPAVPCLKSAPTEWTLMAFDPRDGRAHMQLTSGDHGMTLDADVVGTCKRGDAAESASDQPGMRRFDRTVKTGAGYRADRYYVAPDGCVAFHFDGAGRHADQTAEDVMNAFSFITRAEIDHGIRENSDGRLHLDPEP